MWFQIPRHPASGASFQRHSASRLSPGQPHSADRYAGNRPRLSVPAVRLRSRTGRARWLAGRSGGADAGEDRPAELLRPGELRPVTGGQIEVIHVADLCELAHVRMALLHPLPELSAGELARDDSDRHVVAALVGELLRVARDVRGRRNRALAERRAQLVVEVDEVL